MNFWIDDYTGPDRSSRNTISNNHFGPFVRSESVDIKEAVDSVVVDSNYINGTGMVDKNKSKAWISVKGFNCTIMNNYGVFSVLDGIAVSGIHFYFLSNFCFLI